MTKFTHLKTLLIILALILLYISPLKASEKDNSLVDFSLLGKIYGIVKVDFYGDFSSKKCLTGGFEGVREFVKEKGKNESDVPSFNSTGNEEKDIDSFEQILTDVISIYESQGLKEKDIMRAALDGMLESLGDPYTIYMDPTHYRQFNESMGSSDYSGVGIFIEVDTRNNDQITVLEPIEDSPAYRAGLKPGDQILEIDGVSTKGMNGDKAAELIKGPGGTAVVLKITRPKASHPIEFEIVRNQIHINSISTKILENNIWLIRIRIFGETTGEEFKEALEEMKEKNGKGLIIDLRNNGGGYVTAAISVCSHFIPEGERIVIVKDKKSEESQTSEGYYPVKVPVAVLINRYSASASEITAGALQDHGKAIIIGDTSFGKGSIQSIVELEDGGALKYTVANYFTPSGRAINHIGLEPDIKVKMDEYLAGKANDIQIKKALEILNQ